MNNSIKTLLAILLLGTLGAGGIAAVAQANSSVRARRVFIAQKVEDETEINEERETEAAHLQPLAKITPDQAKESALQVQDGKVTELELEAENGSLVYEVTIDKTEVFVDAGNGNILYTQGVNEKVDEATEQARPRSSIQVPNDENYQ
ncbi:PepSY domain-containing protein [Myxosarcina sp. GI1]|uniref:PepSY domain-containing protein n=1 Tax=Myxosarcina sp. GI1 TaxID=1541065 RepID=UPI000561F638|nr:PepSY domain-containing protein [Myxosarcina sp. GI1]